MCWSWSSLVSNKLPGFQGEFLPAKMWLKRNIDAVVERYSTVQRDESGCNYDHLIGIYLRERRGGY